MRHSRQGPHHLGGRRLQAGSDFPGGVPHQAAEVQIRAAALPSQRLPVRHRLPVDPKRGGGLAPGHHGQGDPAGHPVAARRAEPRVASPGRRVQPVQEGPHRLREEGQADRQGELRPLACRPLAFATTNSVVCCKRPGPDGVPHVNSALGEGDGFVWDSVTAAAGVLRQLG